jgi:hypothetical protein
MSDKPFVAEAWPPMSHASASNGLSDIKTHIKNAPCNQPLNEDSILCVVCIGNGLIITLLKMLVIISLHEGQCTL